MKNSYQSRFVQFIQLILITLAPWILMLIIQGVARLYLFLTYLPESVDLSGRSNDLFRLFKIGTLYDVRVSTYVFGLFFLCALILTLLFPKQGWYKRGYAVILAFLSLFLMILVASNVYYYATYDTQFDVFIFGLVDDDFIAILKTAWNDYPILRMCLVCIVFTFVLFYLYKKWQNYVLTHIDFSPNIFFKVVFIMLFTALFYGGLRGQYSSVPLGKKYSHVSNIGFLNSLSPNAVLSLEWAIKQRKNLLKFEPMSNEASQELFSDFYGDEFSYENFEPVSLLKDKTERNEWLNDNAPHVVFSIMESMGNHMLMYDDPDNRDLYGALREAFSEDWVFKRFVSGDNGTMDSLAKLLLQSPYSAITQSQYSDQHFKLSNMLEPYIQQGYKPIFVTAGNGAWGNLRNFLMANNFHDVIDQNQLMERYPEAEEFSWGVADEFIFRYLQERLIEADENSEKLFIVTLSITHHPPYILPKGTNLIEFSFSESDKKRFTNFNLKELNLIFNTFRYSNNALGEFISWAKQSAVGERIVIAATGDHNMRNINYPDPHEKALAHSVPFYLYLPEAYRENRTYASDRIGGHKDIFPTLYNVTLSDQSYLKIGCDLTASGEAIEHDPWCNVGYNVSTYLLPEGAYDVNAKEFRRWDNVDQLLLGDPLKMDDALSEKIVRWNRLKDLQYWVIVKQIEEFELKEIEKE